MRILFISVFITLSFSAFSQLELNSSGKVGIAGYTPHNSYGLRVNGKIYSNNHVYGSKFGYSTSNYYARSMKIYGSANETSWNVLLTSNSPGVLNANGATIVTSSDDRLKKNKKKIDNASSLIYSLTGQSYYYKDQEELSNLQLDGKWSNDIDSLLVGDSLVAVDNSKKKFAFSKQKHYGFIAQDLQKTLPDLVYYDSLSGTYGIDYLGVIPILVEANKELMDRQEDLERRLEQLEKKLSKNDARSRTNELDESAEDEILPELQQNSPNPFDQQTKILFSLPKTVEDARLFIYNMQGTQVRSINVSERGNSFIEIQSGELAAGMYMYTLIADGQEVGTKKMIITD